MNKKITALVILFITTLCPLAFSAAIPIQTQAKLILKIISFDKNFDRYGEIINIGTTSDDLLQAFDSLKTLTVNGKKFHAGKIESFTDIKKYKAIFVDEKFNDKYNEIPKIAKTHAILLFSTKKDALANGAAVSFRLVDKKVKIFIAKNTAKEQGTDFADVLLKISIVLDK